MQAYVEKHNYSDFQILYRYIVHKLIKNIYSVGLLLFVLVASSGCSREASIASSNISAASDSFQVQRRVIFYNGITDTYILTIEGLCSISDHKGQLEVTCKVGDGEYKKHFLGLSDNVTYFVEQLYSKPVNGYNYTVVFNPQSIIPDIRLKTSLENLIDAVTPK